MERKYNYRLTFKSAVSSVVEHRLHTAGVTGSNPVSRTTTESGPGGGMVDAVDSKSTAQTA